MKKGQNKQQGPSKKNNAQEECIVCFKTIKIISVGECDHPVCYECSTRMRVLLSVKECPICRKEMSQVIICLISENWRSKPMAIPNAKLIFQQLY